MNSQPTRLKLTAEAELLPVETLADRLREDPLNSRLRGRDIERWIATGRPVDPKRSPGAKRCDRIKLPVLRFCGQLWTSVDALIDFLQRTHERYSPVVLPNWLLAALRQRRLAEIQAAAPIVTEKDDEEVQS